MTEKISVQQLQLHAVALHWAQFQTSSIAAERVIVIGRVLTAVVGVVVGVVVVVYIGGGCGGVGGGGSYYGRGGVFAVLAVAVVVLALL